MYITQGFQNSKYPKNWALDYEDERITGQNNSFDTYISIQQDAINSRRAHGLLQMKVKDSRSNILYDESTRDKASKTVNVRSSGLTKCSVSAYYGETIKVIHDSDTRFYVRIPISFTDWPIKVIMSFKGTIEYDTTNNSMLSSYFISEGFNIWNISKRGYGDPRLNGVYSQEVIIYQ